MSDPRDDNFTNRLIKETSPYLLQHAHNPVDWYPWGDEALERASREGKPILVSIGYSACHWCHVMERESFENEETARIMNENFINIKIDREERPDLDHIYMDAVQAMTGSGGWPLNVFLTPDAKPFYGGTYFPPQKAFNRPSWTEVLSGISQAFKERRHEIEGQAENLTAHLVRSNSFGINKGSGSFTRADADEIFRNILKSADKKWGGFGKAPKFPQTFVIKFLLRYYHETKNEEALGQALISIDKMMAGGLYDQVGGGFARYSTDSEWLVPHFEKMLYDNALLVSVIAEAYQLTGNYIYKNVIEETISFIERELLGEEGGFYAALDADSEGAEGKFYTWSKPEVMELLGADAGIFCRFFDISDEGNWEGENILWRKKTVKEFSNESSMPFNEIERIISKGKELLLQARNDRIRPLTDDKIILSWNALMNTALSKAYAATGSQRYRELSERNIHFLLKRFVQKEGGFYHTYKKGQSKYPAFLDDYAFLTEALIHLQETTGNTTYLEKAREIAAYVYDQFSETETGFFYYTAKSQKDVVIRKKEVYDGAIPSGNSVMGLNFYKLSLYFGIEEFREITFKAINGLGNAIMKYPVSFGNWACLLQEIIFGTRELAILGKDYAATQKAVLNLYIPHKILMSSHTSNNYFPLLSDKDGGGGTKIYLCKNYACRLPVSELDELKAIL